MNKLTWYFARMRQMGPAEVLYRTRQAANVPIDYLGKGQRAQFQAPHGEWWSPRKYPVTFNRAGASFEKIRIFDLEFPADFEFDWHRDYRNSKSVERKFSRSLDIRDPEVVGDIKYIWEINRHQHLSALAYSSRPDASDIVARSLSDWLDSNPYMEGVNWTSSLEFGLRLISWAAIFPTMREHFARNKALREKLATSAYLHMKAIRRHLSRYSSANNHLIGELAGLYVGATCFPWWNECDTWRDFARRELEREILAQFTPEGVNREQAMSYQFFTLEMLLFAGLVARNSGDAFEGAYYERLRKGLDYVLLVATKSGDLPWFGDSDDARGFLFSPNESELQAVMSLGAGLFDDERYLSFAPRGTVASKALLGPATEPIVRRASTPQVGTAELLREGGIAVIQADDWKVVMDVGPLGFTTIAAHGHADALSLLLAVKDRYVLVDPGTYAYHSHPEWRAYFRGTAAHNTARVDGQDQSVMRGRFLWDQKANVKVKHFAEEATEICIAAEHDGYTRLSDPVVHRRAVTVKKQERMIEVEDAFECKGDHSIELYWHLVESLTPEALPGGSIRAEGDGVKLDFTFEGQQGDIAIIHGSESPILGWRSTEFNVKHPTSTVRRSLRIRGTQSIKTRIQF
ncbi:heparinase II/III family protein [Candidatus Korobacter versatilis]|uniref:heparinase II/III family protein n=1 Tax=Candidatus Korobacter versatilis TaxID=658062 RepID=UPI00030DEB8F|nr:alginate lyase family protein [Candidatus Koribacter versatilis]